MSIKSSEHETSIFCFANDQAPSKEEAHYWVDFLHQPTSFHLGVEKIAQKTKRSVFYYVMKSVRKRHYEIEFVPISLNPEYTSLMEITDTYAKYLQHTLEEVPSYWLWGHKRWKHKPDTNGVSSLA